MQSLPWPARLRRGLSDGGYRIRSGGGGGLAGRFRSAACRNGPGWTWSRAIGGGMPSKRHIIVGGGTAGMNAITTLREIDHGASEIVLVSAERPYSRMVLPYYLSRDIT